jgi:hypothetical protein
VKGTTMKRILALAGADKDTLKALPQFKYN